MARESGNIIQQIGIQSALGTAVAASRKLAGVTFDLGDKLETKQFRRRGAKFNDVNVINKKWMEGKFEGPGSYNELCYILAGLFPHTVEAVTGGFKWTFLPAAEGNDVFEIFTIEEGDDEVAEMYQDLTLQSLDLNFTRDDVTMSGSCFSKPLDGTFDELTASVVALASRPMAGSEIDVYMDTSFAGIGGTKLTDAFEAKFSMGSKREPKWVLNTSNASWKDQKEIVPDASLTFSTEHNAQSRTLRGALDATKFFQIKATGPLITGSTYYTFKLNFCGQIKNPNRQPDMDGLYGFDYEYGAFLESTMNRGFSFEIVNALEEL